MLRVKLPVTITAAIVAVDICVAVLRLKLLLFVKLLLRLPSHILRPVRSHGNADAEEIAIEPGEMRDWHACYF